MKITFNTPFLLFVTGVFVTLKLLGYITWSWVWIFSPLWILGCLTLLITGVSFVFGALALLIAFAALKSGNVKFIRKDDEK